MDLNNRFFKLARIISYKSKSPIRIGAVLTKNRKVISVGFNDMEKTHPTMYRLNRFQKVHAEWDALIGTSRNDLTDATMFVYRDQRNGQVGMCRPCDSCQFLMKRAGVRHVFYSDPSCGVGYIDLRNPEAHSKSRLKLAGLG